MAGQEEARQEESYSHREKDSPPFLVGLGLGRGERGGGEGAGTLALNQFGLGLGGP